MPKLIAVCALTGLLALAVVTDGAAAAPRAGVWEGKQGSARIHVLIVKRGSGAEIRNWTISCGALPFDDRFAGGPDAGAIRISRRGTLQGQDRQFTGRLKRTRGRLSTNVGNVTLIRTTVRTRCRAQAFEDVRVRRIAATAPADGRFDVTSTGATDLEDGVNGPAGGVLEVFGGGGGVRTPDALLENLPFGGPPLGTGSDDDEFCDGQLFGSGRLTPTGRFTIPASRGGGDASGRLNGPDAMAGSYRIQDRTAWGGPCDSGVLPFTAVRRAAP